MFRFFVSMIFYVVIARWMYAEAAMIFPWAAPSLDKFLACMELPTHDEWSRESLQKFAYRADSLIRRISNDSFSPIESYEETVKPAIEKTAGSERVRIVTARRL